MLNEFKKFAVKGNMLDMAVGIVIGAAFSTIIGSLVGDIITPLLAPLLGSVDFSNLFVVLSQGAPEGPYATLEAAKSAGALTVNYGIFINALINFVIVAFALFLVVRGYNKLQEQEAAKPAAPPKPSAEETLLGEIRDLLKARA